jgi:hypothetical protein
MASSSASASSGVIGGSDWSGSAGCRLRAERSAYTWATPCARAPYWAGACPAGPAGPVLPLRGAWPAGRRPAPGGRGPAGPDGPAGGVCGAAFGSAYAASTPSGPNIRASCEPLAARQPITAAAMTQTAMAPTCACCHQAWMMRIPGGNDQSSAHATVRQGTNQRASGRMLAIAAIANGVAAIASHQPTGTRPAFPLALLAGARSRSTTKKVHMPNAATYSDAITDRTPR